MGGTTSFVPYKKMDEGFYYDEEVATMNKMTKSWLFFDDSCLTPWRMRKFWQYYLPNSKKKTIVAATEGPWKELLTWIRIISWQATKLKVLREAAKKAGYNIQFQTTEFASIFAGIDSGRYQIGFGSISKTPIREEKYKFY